ncbi:MAG TPA: RDD family protein [Vicinamibacterales bacterium]|nr:RDD family protein [Vicinamibacterales bacterium]
MKCPKCHYLSFEPEPRCRNCGYDLDVTPDEAEDLDLRIAEPLEGPLADLTLRSAAAPGSRRPGRVVTLGPIDLDQVVGHETPAEVVPPAPVAVAEPPPLRVVASSTDDASGARPARPAPVPARRRAPSTTGELPLFVKARAEANPDEPLVKLPATPSVPIAVRRRQPPTPRPAPRSAPAGRESASLGPFERDLLQDLRRLEQRVAERAREEARPVASADASLATRRLGAAAIDAALLGSISAGVLWATLRLCDLGLGDAATLPIVPLSAFLLLVAAGYLLMFTVAGGQTVGKMLMGIRVIGDDESGPDAGLAPRQAVMRALLTVPSVLVLGLGFLPAMSGHGLAIHDRLSHTRVIEA